MDFSGQKSVYQSQTATLESGTQKFGSLFMCSMNELYLNKNNDLSDLIFIWPQLMLNIKFVNDNYRFYKAKQSPHF